MGFFGGMGRKMGFFFEKVEKWGATLHILTTTRVF